MKKKLCEALTLGVHDQFLNNEINFTPNQPAVRVIQSQFDCDFFQKHNSLSRNQACAKSH